LSRTFFKFFNFFVLSSAVQEGYLAALASDFHIIAKAIQIVNTFFRFFSIFLLSLHFALQRHFLSSGSGHSAQKQTLHNGHQCGTLFNELL